MKKLLMVSALSFLIMMSSVAGFAKTSDNLTFPNISRNFVLATSPIQNNNTQTLEQKKADILKKATDKINDKVKEGKLTQAEADKKLADFKSILDKWDGKESFCDYFKRIKHEEFKKLPLNEKKDKISEKFNKKIDKAFEDNKITQDQANKMREDLKKALDKWDGNSKLDFKFDKNIFEHHHFCPDDEKTESAPNN